MKRDKRIEIRVTQEELKYYKSCADKSNMPLSNWARNKLDANREYSENAPELAKIITSIQTDINKAINKIDLDESLDNLLIGVSELWQFLKK
jgi:hypothetical protein